MPNDASDRFTDHHPDSSVSPQAGSGETSADTSLSYGQRSLWFLQQLAPDSAAYNVVSAVRIRGELDIAAVECALRRLVARHPAWRTTFPVLQDGPVQRVHTDLNPEFCILEAPTWSRAELDDRMVKEMYRPFDLLHGPLLRVHVFRQSPQEHVVLIAMHHIVTDMWSQAILVSEWGALYLEERTGIPASLPALNADYTDYMGWQAAMLASQEGELHWAYWKTRLAGELPVLNLPTDRPRPPVAACRGKAQELRIDPGLAEKLKTVAQSHRATLFMTLLAAFQVLLFRHTGQEDILVGSPKAGRRRKWSSVAGYFVNPVVLRANLSEDPPFTTFLCQVRQTVREAFEHDAYPFPLLVERLQPARTVTQTPLFQVMFAWEKTTRRVEAAGMSALTLGREMSMPWGGHTLEVVPLGERVTSFDLTLLVAEAAGDLLVTLEYNRDLFDDSTIARMLGHFQILLEGIVTVPDRRISALPLITEAERQQLLIEWNNTAADYPRDRCVHQLFEAQVKRTPDAIAATYEDQSHTYHELNQRANQLAHHLKSLGVGPETLVGICVERSLDMVVGLLGILKAGGAYIPLDPAFPQERLALMLEDSQPLVLLTQQRLLTERLPHQVRVVCLDSDWDAVTRQCVDNPSANVTTDNLAYVLYTSGSTGRPKGVQIPHRALTNFLLSMQREPGLTDQDVLLAVTTLSFDIAGLELYLPLITGARVIIASRQVASDGLLLLKQLGECGATVMQATPATWRMLIDSGWQQIPGLKVLCGGEALPYGLANQLLERGGSLWNMYGPTETTIWSSIYEVKHDNAPIHLGHPIANTQFYILDSHLQPVPIAVPGELYIGGDGIGRGYLHRPDLTAERFLDNPFMPGERLYKTGDLARYHADGTLEFLGRADLQVKVRGFRIELEDIEAALLQHKLVKQAVVVARDMEHASSDKRLVGYIIPASTPAPTASELHVFLKTKLPDYMVPSLFVALDAFPLTPNGKVDRRALPAPDESRAGLENVHVAPRTLIEETLVGIWAEVLRRDQVSVHDNFFEMGGHSLLATQVVSRVRHAFRIELPLRSLFEAPSVAGMAAQIEAALQSERPFQAPPMLPVGRDRPLPLSFSQERMWFIHQLQPESSAYHITPLTRLRGPLNVEALERSFAEMARRHEDLRTTFAAVDGQPVQVIASEHGLRVQVVDLPGLPEAERELEALELARQEARRPFELERGPLMRITLYRLREDDHLLLVVIHHIISDAWSMGVMLQELMALYNAFVSGAQVALPELEIQYSDFAYWQRQWMQGEMLASQLAYWRRKLDNVAVLELPTDRPRPAIQTQRGANQSCELPASLIDDLRRLSQKSGVTLFMTTLAAFQVLLHRYTGQTDIAVGVPIANRHWLDIESLIGTFVNTLVLRTDLAGDPTVDQVLDRVRDTVLEAFAHQDLSFAQLVAELQPKRDTSHASLFQIMFNVINVPMPTPNLKGLEVSYLEVDHGGAQFDLSCTVTDTPNSRRVAISYNTDLFDADTIARFIGHYETVLKSIATRPDLRISELPLLTKTERRQLLVEWNDTKAVYPRDRCIHQLFTAQAERTPNAIAAVCEQEQVTFQELNRRANQLAHHLHRLGVGPETLVGICMERSPEMLVGLLGILKAGGAYVPLDPSYPKERLVFMLQDSQVPVLLTQQRLVAKLPKLEAHLVCVDTAWEAISHESVENPDNTVTPENLAYVIYTSGSTGTPKGVLGLHRGAINRFQWMWNTFPFTSDQVACQKTALSFVDSVWEVFGPLLQGIRTVIIPDAVVKDPLRLAQSLAAHRVTRIVLVPSLLQVILDACPDLRDQLPCLTMWVSSGEALPLELCQRFHTIMPHSTLINLYGSSEVAADCTWYETKPSEPCGSVPIGRPIANTRIYILDSNLQPVPVSVPGDLYVGGDGLARGYLNRPELTAERFIQDPFSDQPNASMYKTGDLARYLPDGNLEYLGRLDNQVKIHGIRIELGDIEAALSQHEQVRQAVVIAREDPPGDKRLVGYLVPTSVPAPTAGELRAFLKDKLPDYMVPSLFVALDAFPLTPNGKVDRRALPAPEMSRSETEHSHIAARNQTERELVKIWEELLGVRPIGVTDNFFDLGGHSLLAIRLFSQIEQVMSKQLALTTIFESPTIEQMTDLIGHDEKVAEWSPVVAIQRGRSELPLFCVHGFGGGVLDYGEMARLLGPERPVYGLLAKGMYGQDEPLERIEDMAAYCIHAMRSVQPAGPYAVGGYCIGGVIAFEMARQLVEQGQKVALVAVLEGHAPLKERQRMELRHWLNFMRNLPFWLNDYLRAGGRQMLARVGRVARITGKQIARRLGARLPVALEDVLDDISNIPEDRRRLMEVLIRAEINYVPRIYSGPITLFRVRGQSLWRSHDPTLGWGELTTGGVKIKMIEGAHHNILELSYVQSLAEQFKASLEQEQAAYLHPQNDSTGAGSQL